MNSLKRQKDMTLKDDSIGRQVPNLVLDKSGEIATERMKRLSQSENDTQV